MTCAHIPCEVDLVCGACSALLCLSMMMSMHYLENKEGMLLLFVEDLLWWFSPFQTNASPRPTTVLSVLG
jgi:hypothetical protein